MLLDREFGDLTEPWSGRRWQRDEIMRRWEGRAGLLRSLGLVPGGRVLLHHSNTLEFFVDLLAVWVLGGCAIPIDPRLTSFEVDTLAQWSTPGFSIWRDSPDRTTAAALQTQGIRILDDTELALPSKTAPTLTADSMVLDHDALILFTSGTTGDPKGVVHTHRSLRARWMALRQVLGTQACRRTLCLLPTHFGHGLICNCLFPWLSGQDLFVLPSFKTDVVMQLGRVVDEHAITFMSSVPSLWRLAVKTVKPPVGRTLDRVLCGSAPLSSGLWHEIREWTGAREVANAYGITETGSWLAGTAGTDAEPEDELIGPPWGSVICVLKSNDPGTPPGLAEPSAPGEAGYIWVNTPALMRGYLGRDDLTRQVVSHGWFYTGDIGLIDARGWLYLRGREREEINKGGMKIHPGDVDRVVERFDGVVDVCTFRCPDPLYGETVGIALVLKEVGESTLRHLHEWTLRHLAKHQMPQHWYVLAELPRTSHGKVNRDAVASACTTMEPTRMPRVDG